MPDTRWRLGKRARRECRDPQDAERGVAPKAPSEDEKFKELLARPLVKVRRKEDDDYEDVTHMADDDDEYEEVGGQLAEAGDDDEMDLDAYFEVQDGEDDDDEYEQV